MVRIQPHSPDRAVRCASAPSPVVLTQKAGKGRSAPRRSRHDRRRQPSEAPTHATACPRLRGTRAGRNPVRRAKSGTPKPVQGGQSAYVTRQPMRVVRWRTRSLPSSYRRGRSPSPAPRLERIAVRWRRGGLAQLGERLPCTQEVVDSNSTSSTTHMYRGSSIGRTPVSKTGCWGFETLPRCQVFLDSP